jgi:hypothetical protein
MNFPFLSLKHCPKYSETHTKPNSESELLYDWRFTAKQLFLASGPLRPKSRDFFQLNSCGNSPYVTPFLTRRWVCLLWPFVKCIFRTCYMLLEIFPCALYTSPLSVQALHSRSCLTYILCYNSSLAIWTVVSLITGKLKSLILFSLLTLFSLYSLHTDNAQKKAYTVIKCLPNNCIVTVAGRLHRKPVTW